MNGGTLYIIATPIGNLEDITLRALRVLKEVDVIYCEDTRHAKCLLGHYEIKNPTKSYHQHSSVGSEKAIIKLLLEGKNIALISDAGTPGINDPGVRLAAAVWEEKMKGAEITISPIPGPSAFVSGLSVAGLPTDEFIFHGFIPHKKGRETFFRMLGERKGITHCMYESSHRIEKTVHALQGALDETRTVCVMRELTKVFETLYRGSIAEVAAQVLADPIKGEYGIFIH